MQHAEGRLAELLGDRQLVHLLVVALLQVDDLALRGAADQDHREAVGRGIGERSQAVEKTGSRDREADAGLFCQIAGDGRCIAGVLLVAKRDDADACGLRHAAEVRDGNTRHAVDRVDAVELERVDGEVKAIRQLLLCYRCVRLDALRCCGHFAPSLEVLVGACSALLLTARGRRRARATRRPHETTLPSLVLVIRFFPDQSSSTKRSTCSRKRNVCSRTRRSARSVSRASSAATISLWSTIERLARSCSEIVRWRMARMWKKSPLLISTINGHLPRPMIAW